MKLIDIQPNQVFIFRDNNWPYLRVELGYCDLFPNEETEVFYPANQETLNLGEEVIKVDRSLLWKKGYEYDMPQYIIEQKAKELVEKYERKVLIGVDMAEPNKSYSAEISMKVASKIVEAQMETNPTMTIDLKKEGVKLIIEKIARVYKERRVYYFTCSKCGHGNRQSFKRKRANVAVCKKCRKNVIPENQLDLFS